jgi:hypothetical protein
MKFFKGVGRLYHRIKFLIDGKIIWAGRDGNQFSTTESWELRWAISGIHSYKWWWVRRYGKLPCGCTRNPLTRRILTIKWRCRKHSVVGKRPRLRDPDPEFMNQLLDQHPDPPPSTGDQTNQTPSPP